MSGGEPPARADLPVRADLLALDADALAALSNRGLVKRAAREVDREPPKLAPGEEAAVVAEFGDGVRTELPVGGLDRGRCSCGAVTVCRHVLALIFAYQGAVRAEAAAPAELGLPEAGLSEAGPSELGSPEVALPDLALSGLAGLPGADALVASGADAQPGVSAGPLPAVGSPTGAAQSAGGVRLGAAGGGPGAEVQPGGGARATAQGEGFWSPGEFTDAELSARIGARLIEAARRAYRVGFSVRVRRGVVPVVELPAATVRFLVPRDLGYVHTDARAGVRDDVIALAVWAFRAADAQQPGAAECVVEVGGAGPGAAEAGTGLEALVEFAAEVLRDGAVHAGLGLAAVAAGHVSRLERAGLRWPLDATVELADQLAAYRERSARYSPETLADLIVELFARHRAVVSAGGRGLRSRVLGSEESAETPLRRVRLDGLGARVTAIDDQRRVEIFHAQPAAGVVLVAQRQWAAPDNGPALGRRRVGGATVAAMAGGVLVTESAARSASRAVRLTTSRVGQSTVTASSGAWADLPPSLLATDYARLAAEVDGLPPRWVRARVRAEMVRVLAVAEVCGISYSAGEQRLTVEIRDSTGTPATVVAAHASVAPGRLDAVTAAFSGRHGNARYVAGSVHRGGGGLVVDPYAIAADGPLIVPDLSAPDPARGQSGRFEHRYEASDSDALAAAVGQARAVLAEVAHTGLAHLPGGFGNRLRETRQGLAGVGLHRVAAAVDRLAGMLGPDPSEPTVRAWVDASLRVGLAAESL